MEPVWSIAADRHHVAAFYRNGALHHIVNRAIVELAILRVAAEPIEGEPIEAAWEDALRLRDLFKFEFFFADKEQFRDQLIDELSLLGWGPDSASSRDAADLIATAPILVAHGVLRSFADAQLVVAERLAARDPREALDRDAFLRACLSYGRQLVLQQRLANADAVSRELFEGALRLAANRDLVDPGREEVAAGRRAWLAELVEVRERLLRIAQLDATRLEEVLDGHA
jgi:glycerol-3-phosphate O-acyltransferase